MKKTYNKPTAEKLAFKYRDQIVAASGDNSSGGSDNDFGLDDVIGYLFNRWNFCQYFG